MPCSTRAARLSRRL